MTTTFLRFPSEVAFMAMLPAEFMLEGETGSPLPAGVDAISIIGTIEQGDPPVQLPGWHVNMLGVVPPEWAAYVVNPTAPVRVFGVEP